MGRLCVYISPIQPYPQSNQEITRGWDTESIGDPPRVEDGDMVPQNEEDVSTRATYNEQTQETATTPNEQGGDSPTVSTDENDIMPIIRQKFINQGYSNKVIKVLMKGWRIKTKKQYQVYLKKWTLYCKKRKWEPNEYKVQRCVKFLMNLYKEHLGYSAINTARSALSALFDNPPVGEKPVIKRFMRGIFNTRPTKPRYTKIWDVSVVLKYLDKCAPAHELTLKQLTMKVVTLCALVTAQRCQTLHAMNLDHCQIGMTNATFNIRDILKHNTPKNNNNDIILPSYPDNKRLCVVTYLKKYIKRTKPFRRSQKLFISFQSPYHPVSKDTISRWIKATMQKAGIDTQMFKAHSTRAAATSAVTRHVDISTILKTAGWSNCRTFATYYDKRVEGPRDKTTFGRAVLKRK